MEADPHIRDGEDAAARRLTALQHRHRNRMQIMSSLVGLFGRRMPPGESRDALADLRARFEALNFLELDDAKDDAEVRVDLPALAERLLGLLEPDGRRDVTIAGGSVTMGGRAAEAACQIFVEMIIALHRRGLPAEGGGSGRVLIERARDRLAIRVEASGVQRPQDEIGELGWMLAESHARGCDAELVQTSDGPFRIEAIIPLAAAPH